MSNYHAWKRRLWGPDYPLDNGPPYRDPATGAPILPGGIQGGPYQGVDDNGPVTGNPVVLTITGPATGAGEVVILIDDQTAAAPSGGRWVGCSFVFADGATATQIADGLVADFNARNWDGWLTASNVAGVITFTPQAAGSATGYVTYQPAAGSVGGGSVPGPIGQLPPGATDGPTTSPHGDDFFIRRSGGQGTVWYVGWDVDGDPEPDAFLTLTAFQGSADFDEAYKADVLNRARTVGWMG